MFLFPRARSMRAASVPSKAGPLAALFAFSFLLLSPEILFDRVSPQTDIVYHYTWSAQFARSLSEGELYPRWLPNEKFGLGDPTFVYYPPLYSALVSMLSATGLGTWTAMKTVEFAATWLTGLFAFLLLRKFISRRWALAGAFTVQSSPFLIGLLVNFSARPWYLATPFVLGTLLYAACEDRRAVDPRLALAYAAVVLAHVLTGFMTALCLPFLVAGDRAGWRRRLTRVVLSMGLGACLASVYLVPALLDLAYIRPDNWMRGDLDWHGAFVFPLLTSRFYHVRWFAFQWIVPAAALAMTATLAVFVWSIRVEHSARFRLAAGMLGISSAALFLSSELSYPIWSAFGVLQMVQFPYRFTYLQMIAATLGGFTGGRHDGRAMTARLSLVLPVLSSVVLTPAIMRLGLTESVSQALAEHAEQAERGAPEYLSATAGSDWLQFARNGGLAAECANQGIVCEQEAGGSEQRAWRVRTDHETVLVVPVFSYPAWRALLDGRAVRLSRDRATGLIQVDVPRGQHKVELRWAEVPNGKLGQAGSAAAAVLLLIVSARFVRPRNGEVTPCPLSQS